jgi:hypothetical protein
MRGEQEVIDIKHVHEKALAKRKSPLTELSEFLAVVEPFARELAEVLDVIESASPMSPTEDPSGFRRYVLRFHDGGFCLEAEGGSGSHHVALQVVERVGSSGCRERSMRLIAFMPWADVQTDWMDQQSQDFVDAAELYNASNDGLMPYDAANGEAMLLFQKTFAFNRCLLVREDTPDQSSYGSSRSSKWAIITNSSKLNELERYLVQLQSEVSRHEAITQMRRAIRNRVSKDRRELETRLAYVRSVFDRFITLLGASRDLPEKSRTPGTKSLPGS